MEPQNKKLMVRVGVPGEGIDLFFQTKRDDAPGHLVDEGCEVCMKHIDDCECPQCRHCGTVGDPECLTKCYGIAS